MSRARWGRRALIALGVLFAGWLGLALMLYALQRSLLFPAPNPARAPQATGGSLIRIPQEDAPPVVAFYLPASSGKPTVLFIHGNGEQLADGDRRAAALRERGLGYLGVEYPGYGLAEGAPGEASILQAARTAAHYLTTLRRVPNERVVLYGQSLGSGAATALAHDGVGGRLALVTPFTSITDAAGHHFPWLPVRWLVKDRFDSLKRAPDVQVPVLIIHGTQDGVVPYAHGKKLSETFPNARLLTVEGAGHNDLFAPSRAADGSPFEALLDFLEGG